MLSQAEIRESVTSKIVEALRSGAVPFWRKPWSEGCNAGYPTNAVTGKHYRGVNLLLLSLAGHASKWWATYNQWRSIDGQVRRGEKGTQIILYKPITRKKINDDGEEEVSSFPLMKTWTVFNIAQVDGNLDQFRASYQPNPGAAKVVDFGPAEEVIAATGADIRYGGDRAFYSPEDDLIKLPPKDAFETTHEFYGVLAHEVTHWTGHTTRLNRLSKFARFGNESYAVEELVAELGSAFLLAELGIPQSEDLSNAIGYLDHWVKVLQRDHTAIFTASSAASKAVDYVLSFSKPKDEAASDTESESVAVA